MAQAVYLLAAASGLAEGVACSDGKAVGSAPITRLGAKGALAEGIGAVVTAAQWPPGPAVIVVATDTVGFRRLSFPFKDARRVRQSLRYALESELLEQVDAYALDHDLIPEETTARALVSLLRQDLLGALLQAGAAHGLQTYRVLSAAHALLAARPPASPDHVQIYVGAEEAFLTVVRAGHVDQIQALPGSLAAVLGELAEHGVTSPDDVRSLLAGTEEDERANRSLLRTRLMNELRDAVDQIGRFLRVQPPAGATVSVHGLYAPWVEVDAAAGTARVAAEPGAGVREPRHALGILHELMIAPEGVLSAKGPGFFRAAASWQGLLHEVRRPALACAALVALALLVAGGTYGLRTAALWRQIDRTGQELQALVTKRVGANVPESARMSVLREQLAAVREQAKVTSRAAAVPYAILGAFADLSVQAAAMPGVSVETVQISQAQVTVAGDTPTFQSAEALRDKLGAMPRFAGRQAKLTYQRTGQTLAYRITVQ